MNIYDTIAAIATPPGEGGIGIIRISGSDSLKVLREIFKPIYGNDMENITPRKLIYGNIIENKADSLDNVDSLYNEGSLKYTSSEINIIDEVLVAYMKGPNSYTAEDVVEINCHGGYISLKRILDLILKRGVRLAEAGEFTKRAFLNGRIDLSQAEAVMDVIISKTQSSHEIAQGQLEGGLSDKIRALRNSVTELLARVEVAIDYPEEDIEHIAYEALEEKIQVLYKEIKNLYDTSEIGRVFRDGLKTVIVGRPNVGKSSLLNSILGENRAIVTNIPGTTRDVIEEFINVKGIPLRIVDTAGIRETDDTVEKIGVEKSRQSYLNADLIIQVIDSSENLTDDDRMILEELKDREKIILLNKIDLDGRVDLKEIEKYESRENIIEISALNSHGIDDIYSRIEQMVFHGRVKSTSDLVITNSRHKDALYKSLRAIDDAKNAIEGRLAFDFIEVDLRNIWEYLGYINGDTVREDLLDSIFENFCIGK